MSCNYNTQIGDVVTQVVSSYTSEECRAGFTGHIRDEILKAIQNMFKSEFIYRAIYSCFVLVVTVPSSPTV